MSLYNIPLVHYREKSGYSRCGQGGNNFSSFHCAICARRFIAKLAVRNDHEEDGT